MVLAGDFDLAGGQLAHGMVAAAVAEFHLKGTRSARQRNHLMPQADAEDGQPPAQRAHQIDHRAHILGISGAVGEEQPIGLEAEDGVGRGIVGHHGHVAAELVELSHDVELDAAVYRHHAVTRIGRAGVPLLLAADAADAVGGQAVSTNTFQRLLDRGIRVADQRALAALVADHPADAPRVHTLQAGNAVFFQNLAQRFGIAEVAGHVAVFAHHQPAHGGHTRLIVLVGDAVVADERIGHHHRLRGVAGIGHDFLIADHGSVEHQLAYRVVHGAEARALMHAAVFHHQHAPLYFLRHTQFPPT